MIQQPDPIQAAMEALDAIQNGVLWGSISKQVRDEFSQEISTIRDVLKQLRAHQSEVAALKEAVLDLGMFIKAEAATCAAIYNEHAATIKAAGGA